MEMLVQIPREKWPSLLNIFEKYWPEGAVAYCLLDTQIKYPELSNDINFKVFCPEGTLYNGMVAIFIRHNSSQVVIQPLGKNITKIEESLFNTKLINWTDNVVVPSSNQTVIECLERLKNKLSITLHYGYKTKAYKHLFNKSSKPFTDLMFPPNVYVKPLKEEYIDIVDKTWTFHNAGSYKYFELLIKHDLSYVLYIKQLAKTIEAEKEIKYSAKDNNKIAHNDSDVISEPNECNEHPIAWLFVNELGALCHLFCLKEYRQKGYAQLLTKYVLNKMLQNEQNVLAYTMENNINPQTLFRKLGFEDVGIDFWVKVREDDAI